MPIGKSSIQRFASPTYRQQIRPAMRKGFASTTSLFTAVASLPGVLSAACNSELYKPAFVGPTSIAKRETSSVHFLRLQEVQKRMVSTFPNDGDIVTAEDDKWNDVLPFEKSAHNSATVTVPEEETALFERDKFRDRLKDTCEALQELNKSSVWVKVPMSRASLIEEMIDLGFEYHHAHGRTANLNLWLRDGTESKVPEFATHHVGVGAVVVNTREEILCVRELRMNYMPWKVPGGLSELGESISDAAEREVMEETGIPAKFHSILSFRHTHGMANGRSDLYFVCRLDPIEEVDGQGSAIIPEPYAQECEIEATKWVPLNEYRDMVNGVDDAPGHPMMRSVMKVFDQGIRISQKEVKSVVPGRKANPMYIPEVL